MNEFTLPTGGPGDFGLWIAVGQRPKVMNRTGSAVGVGDVLQFDLLASQAETTTVSLGESSSIFSNVIAPTAAAIRGEAWTIFCVALTAGADNTEIQVQTYGILPAFVIGAAGSMAVGTDLVVTTAKNFDIVSEAGEIIVGIGAAAVTTPTSRTLGLVYFNGFVGMTGGQVASPIDAKFRGANVATAGGDAVETVTLTGLATTDVVHVQLRTVGATPRTILTAAPTTNTLTVTFSGDPSTDHRFDYIVFPPT
jgi:hypothetical protein